jgi:demethylmacrocin O-methyltransferase
MKTLSTIYQQYAHPDGNGDKGTAHTYIDEYERLLAPYRNNPNGTFLEIGVSWGLSMQMWHEYFAGSVMGIDIHLHPNTLSLRNTPRLQLVEVDATTPQVLDVLGVQQFDVIIDDGSHRLADQIQTFELLRSHVRTGGLYIIEDVENIDVSRSTFEQLHDGDYVIIDNRSLKNRYDDVLVVYKF